ncbi:T9SS type A sorting domain-containing protein [Rhodocytophaga rosea]|uniref:T9SS type A sorting domain-containing protein n=1 Tax=Rhodocytophaga rosea TaxID=2704465 RepID=A0A6C0GFC0_9BACT|nr:T9SS type A sorting domain-containing protein [Rhodocytophaga rosea]QHT66432.1 T9SS type A sorting domain-containing protein [Rhodocytophaga rosea]
MKHKLLFSFLLLFCLPFSFLHGQDIDTTMWVTDNRVNAVVQEGNIIYLGGLFNYIGPNTGGGAVVNIADGQLTNSQPLHIEGTVRTVISDGKGGWYIAGLFSKIQGVTFNNIAHILSDGNPDKDWKPQFISYERIDALALSGSTVYVGGSFSSIDGQARNALAAIDATTGVVTAWNPNPDGGVNTLAVVGNKVYAGGVFSSIGGQARNGLAAIDATAGVATAWNPDVTGGISTLAIAENKVYAGGLFSSIGGQSRNNLAAIDATTGVATAWNPNPDGGVNTLAIAENKVYVGGNFASIGGQSRRNLAAIDATTGVATAWNSDVSSYTSGSIYAIAISGNTVYVGGGFAHWSIGGKYRNYLAAIDANTGLFTSWNPNITGGVNTLAVAENKVYVGGDFSSIGGQVRNGLAAIDASTGAATSWNPNVIGRVNTLAVAENKVYVGGDFSSIGGQVRNGLAAIDASTGAATSWNPNITGEVYTLTVAGNKVYAGGFFTSVGGQARNALAAIDVSTGLATAWNPGIASLNSNSNTYISTLSISISKNTLYAGGSFTSVGGQARNGLAAIDASTGVATAWNPNPDGGVNTLAIAENKVYVGGNFASIGGQARNGLAAIDASTGLVTAWNPNITGGVSTLAIIGNKVYAGGSFTSVGGQSRYRLAAIDATTGIATAWNPSISAGGVNTLVLSGNRIFVGGNFKNIASTTSPYFASFINDRPLHVVKGTIYEDTNGNCKKDPGENGLADRIVFTRPGNYFTSSDSFGNYALVVDSGSYTIQQVIPTEKAAIIKQVCPANSASYSVQFTASAETILGKDFANQTILLPYLSVSVSSDRRRRCMTNTTIVSYCNSGKGEAENAQIYVKLPEYVVLKSASSAYTVDKEGNYVFSIDSIAANTCGSFNIQDSVICGNPDIRGLTQCTKVWITPANDRIPSENWDHSDINVKAKCLENGRVRLGIYNTGKGSMADSSAFRIYLDAQLVFTSSYKLGQGDSLILQVPANGQTVRLEADQHLHHPSKKQSYITVEACGINDNGTVSKGYVNQQPQEEEEPEIATECLPIIDSFDPNDKAVSPQGVSSEYYTPTNKALDYVIRFQNTGTDVAYKVVVVDTLSSHLDISTLQVGAVSHPYKLSVSGKGKLVLTFTFNNINLPDSTRDQLASNGFIKFSIKPLASIAEKTVIENYADIFFDFNEPVRTNTVFNSIYDIPATVVEAVRLNPSVVCQTTNTTIQAGGSRSICEQDTIILQAVSPLQGQGSWKRVQGTGIIEDIHSAQSLVSGLGYGENVFEWKVSANTCTDSLRAPVSITRLPKPTTPIITQAGNDSLVCNVIGAEYEWSLNGDILEQTSKSIYVNKAGTYRVRVKDSVGCISEESAAFSFVLTAIDTYLSSLINVYPNPSSGRITISIPASLGPDVELSVVDAIGKNIQTFPITIKGNGDYRQEIDLSNREKGLYICKLHTSKGVVVKKLFKQ